MRNRFTEIACFMDPVREINSLRELLKVHRKSAADREALTFGRVHERHQSTEAEVKILAYNTFLLPGVQVQTWCQYINRRLVTNLGDKIGEKPNRAERATGMVGHFRDHGYDYVFLCEVYDEEMKTILNEGLMRRYGRIQQAAGSSFETDYIAIPHEPLLAAIALHPATHFLFPLLNAIRSFEGVSCGAGAVVPGLNLRRYGAELLNSGLYALGLNRSFVPPLPIFPHITGLSHRFETRGDYLKDSDYHSAKGVLRTVLPVGIGQIEVYSTHMYAGGGFIGAEPSEAEKNRVKLAQVDEMIAFVNAQKKPGNVCVILGDINIEGMDVNDETYREFISRMNRAGFDDIWIQRCVDREGNVVIQPTADTTKDICDVEGQLCNELAAIRSSNPERLDYIFIERQKDSHSFVLDYTRPRRAPFYQEGVTEGMNFLSDHLGLEITLKVSAK